MEDLFTNVEDTALNNAELKFEPQSLTIHDFPNICRFCLRRNGENLQNFQELYFENGVALTDFFITTISVQMATSTNLPSQICCDCIEHIAQMYVFIKQFKENDIILKAIEKSQNVLLLYIDENGKYESTVEKNVATVDERESTLSMVKCECGQNFVTNQEFICHKNNLCKSGKYLCETKHKVRSTGMLCDKRRMYKCEICKKRFKFAQNLSRHKQAHIAGRPFPCNICGKSFTRSFTREEHMRAHTGDKPFICNYCGKRFNRTASYRLHVSRHKIQISERKGIKTLALTCTKCNKEFSSKWTLKSHMLIHFGEKKFVCVSCGRGFVTKAGLESHSRVHTGLKPYQCNICAKLFSQKSSLKNHLIMHSGNKPHKCNICLKTFSQRSHLNVHQRLHSGEKPYICSFCGKAFSLNCNLKVHTRIHTGETPYVCSICNQGYHDSSSFRKHVKTHSTETTI